jgi:aminopeptidase N
LRHWCAKSRRPLIFRWQIGEHAELAVDFVRANFAALAARQGPQFRNTFFSNLMGNFTDPARAAELAAFAPVHETSGGRIVAARTQERILADADFAARALPAIDAWIGRQNGRP